MARDEGAADFTTDAALRAGLQLALVVLFVGAAAFGVRWMIATKPGAPQRPHSEPVYAVRAVEASAGLHQPIISVFGEVSARRSVELRSLVAGPVVGASDNLIVGGRVAAGEVLVRIDPFSFEGAVDEARANLTEAEARLTEAQAQLDAWGEDHARIEEQVRLAERDLERASSLAGNDTIAERAVDERRLTLVQRRQALETSTTNRKLLAARLDQQKASIVRLAWRLRQAERDLRDTELRAPFDGVVRSESVGLGKRLSANDVVAQIYEAGGLDLRFTLSDSQFGRLSADDAPLIGREATVSWAIGDAPVKTRAVVDRIGPEVSPLTGGVSVLARIDGKAAAKGLRPGAFVTVSLPDRGFRDSVRLPEESLYSDDHVFALRPEECEIGRGRTPRTASETRIARLERVDAAPLAWDGGDVLVRGALDGRMILTSRLAEAGDGVKVRIVPALQAAGTNEPGLSDEPGRAAASRDGSRG